MGTIHYAPFSPREVVRRAFDLGAMGVIVAHNHPSGHSRPSADDIRVTRDLVAACAHFSIVVHDHIVMSAFGHCSMKAEGYMIESA